MTDKICISCKRRIVNNPGSTFFKCPQCSKYDIDRCANCRSNAVKYVCPQCGFTGPN